MSTSKPRLRVAQACTICKGKKVKCDGAVPQCRTCIINHRPCTYDITRRHARVNKKAKLSSTSPASTPHDQLPEASTPDEAERQQPLHLLSSLSHAQTENLFRTYFACIHPIWPLLYKPILDSVTPHDLVSVLPKALVYAMFSIALCIQSDGPALTASSHDCPEDMVFASVEPAKTSSQFFHAAILEIQRDGTTGSDFNAVSIFKPSIPNCQVLTILALQQHGVAEFARAGILCSLAAAMAVELRINRNIWAHDEVEKEVASRLWWNIFILDKMLASEMGRPIVLRAEDSDAPYPSTSESDEYELFTLVRQRKSTVPESIPALKLRTLSAFHTTIDLTKLMEKVMRNIYSLGARELIRQDRSYGDGIRMTLSAEVQGWEQNVYSSPLRLELGKETLAPPAMVTNYVAVKSMIILLHRPFVSHWQQHKDATGHPPFNTLDPSDVCIQAAKKICLILEMHSEYLPRLPSDLIFIIFTVAGILFRHCQKLTHSDGELREVQQYLRHCMHWLRIFSKNWKNADARRDILNERYTWPSTPNTSREPSVSNPAIVAGQPADAMEWASSTELYDETHFANILNEIEEWGFLQNFGDTPYVNTT